ncbi:amidohydrolase family protein [Flaviramulus sp. BrNp1-15]|uniref:amidohydrolase family protein n=1 Tax=Flaviramulus sp. BrNp1-15 TaxID=2916754 RepID=UPI001EE8D458|nr:amidohydrolase family protein [Flaviramulus sp. BrNp1-15]ULC57943.1 amidohydrolase family protein [Flaviramulus sp. BrNp1-15]
MKTLKTIVIALLILAVSKIVYSKNLQTTKSDSKTTFQKDIDTFLKNQPIIDTHFHITKGFKDEEMYNQRKVDIDSAKLDWVIEDFNKNNVVLVLGGGTLKYANMYAKADKRFWAGLVFPCTKTVEQDEPCDKEFFNETELREIYNTGNLKILGESMFNYYGVPPTDERLAPYWKIAEEFNIPIGIHADNGPPLERVNKEERPNYNPVFANPELLKPILEKHPKLKIYLMHYGGGYSEQSLELMKLYPQIYCDISAVSLFAPKQIWEPQVKRLFNEGLGDRLMFASDYFGTLRENIEIIYNLDWLTDEQKKAIYYDNAVKFLGLSKSQIQQHYKMVKEKK